MNTQELLQQFCANSSEEREYLKYIFKRGEYLCAANGRAIVFAQDDGTFELHQDASDTKPDVKKFMDFHEWEIDKFIPLEFSDTPRIKDCPHCDDKGKTLQKTKCLNCDGDGWFKHGKHEYDCLECDGEGRVISDTADGEVPCEDCDGKGYSWRSVNMPDGRMFNYDYLQQLKTLPDVRYLPCGAEMEPMKFKFNNGYGLLMPMRK